MVYQLKQYNYQEGGSGGQDFMTSLNAQFKTLSGTSYPILYKEDYYKTNHSYYFYGMIQEVSGVQTINIKLINKDEDQSSVDRKMQFIKTIKVPSSTNRDYYYFEFIFKPMTNFDSILFEFVTSSGGNRRIGCADLSELNNIINNNNYLAVTGSSLIRFSIQAKPGFLMCLNGEEIRVPKNGIYEVKNGIILIDFFTPVAYNTYETDEFLRQKTAYSSNKTCMNNISSQQAIRNFHYFTVDYLYYTLN